MDSRRNWADIQSDVFDSILQKLPFADRFRSQGVCKNWHSNIKTHISLLLKTIQSQPPLLMLPNNEITEGLQGLCVVDIVEQKQFGNNKDLPRKFDQGFIGSTKGWLVFTDQEADSRLEFFNPFLNVGFKTNLQWLFDMPKFAIWSFPFLSDYNNYGIVVIYKNIGLSRIFYAKRGDIYWGYLGEYKETSYCDIVCCNHLVYVLSGQSHLEAWDFRPMIPTKCMHLEPDPPEKRIVELQNYPGELYRIQSYLIVSNGEILMVRRYVGYHVRNDGIVVSEADIDDDQHEGYSFRYQTKSFYVYKLDFSKVEWVRVEDLGDRVILLGGNESALVQSGDFKEFEKNSIYFTDDFWEGMNIFHEYGGHDYGIYRLNAHSIKLLSNSWKVQPTPFWVIPRSL